MGIRNVCTRRLAPPPRPKGRPHRPRERRASIDALAEVQDQVPKPHARVLAAPDALAKLIHAARARCKMDGTWEMRRVD